MNFFLEVRDAPGKRLVLLHHGAGEETRFAFDGAEKSAAGSASLRVVGNFQGASALKLPFEIEHTAHFVEMLSRIAVALIRTRWRHAHRAPPAAIAPVPSSALRNSCRARSSTTPTKARRTPSASAISS